MLWEEPASCNVIFEDCEKWMADRCGRGMGKAEERESSESRSVELIEAPEKTPVVEDKGEARLLEADE